MKQSVSVLFPIYNDGAIALDNIRTVYALLSQAYTDFEVILIDDASDPAYSGEIKALVRTLGRIRYYRHTKNLGIASTCRDLYAKAQGERIVISSLDGGWDMRDILRLERALETYDIVVGTRMNKSTYTPLRQLISHAYTMTIRIFFGIEEFDAGSAKAFRRRIFFSIPVISQSVYGEAERLIRAKYLGYTIGTIPVAHYTKPSRQTIIMLMSHIRSSMCDLIRLWFVLRVYPVILRYRDIFFLSS